MEAVCSDMSHAYFNKSMSPRFAWFCNSDSLYEECKKDMYQPFQGCNLSYTEKEKLSAWSSTSDKVAICSGETDIAAISDKPASFFGKLKNVLSKGVNKDVALRN